eukprot:4343408-Pyramimonas_sp.AAC.1
MGLVPSVATSTTLECLAVLWALMRVLVEQPQCSIMLDSDSMGTIRAAVGSGLPASDLQLARLVQVAWDFCAAKSDITISHVKAHEGHPWNILADNIA